MSEATLSPEMGDLLKEFRQGIPVQRFIDRLPPFFGVYCEGVMDYTYGFGGAGNIGLTNKHGGWLTEMGSASTHKGNTRMLTKGKLEYGMICLDQWYENMLSHPAPIGRLLLESAGFELACDPENVPETLHRIHKQVLFKRGASDDGTTSIQVNVFAQPNNGLNFQLNTNLAPVSDETPLPNPARPDLPPATA